MKQGTQSVRKMRRPPKEMWLVITSARVWQGIYSTKRAAERGAFPGDFVVGPYQLAQEKKARR